VIEVGTIRILAEKVGGATYLSRLVKLVDDSMTESIVAEHRADILARRLTRLGFIMTGATLFLTRDLYRALSVLLIMSCPCATVLAASTALAAALANAARHRIVVKGGSYVEDAATIDTVCLDKTGTVTTEIPEVIDVIPHAAAGQTSSSLLTLAAAVEANSSHPVGRAIVEAARDKGVLSAAHVSGEIVLGRGIRARVNGDRVVVGNLDFMAAQGIDPREFARAIAPYRGGGHTLVCVAKNDRPQGVLIIANHLREGFAEAIQGLRREGVSSFHLISGDSLPATKLVADRLGIESYQAPILPQDKSRYVDELQGAGKRVLMVGDGVNDALAISHATIGVAMGQQGNDVAVETADVVLTTSDPAGLVFLRELSRRTRRTIEQNFWLATGTNLAGAFGGLTGALSPLTGGAVHMAHSAAIFWNSTRLLRWRVRRRT
jgi:cation-transporting P-type ATPase C